MPENRSVEVTIPEAGSLSNGEKPPAIPDDVWTFAVHGQVARPLAALLEMTRQVFPRSEPVLELEDDPNCPSVTSS
jgi:hypothetical protein